ncbi:hypothetical protein Hdeb2414_s0262g00851521 [Helianthus debilis subsp. tardiflorus]
MFGCSNNSRPFTGTCIIIIARRINITMRETYSDLQAHSIGQDSLVTVSICSWLLRVVTVMIVVLLC